MKQQISINDLEIIGITKVNKEMASQIIDSRIPLGRFYTISKVSGKKIYVGIDNRSGDSWTEDFKSLSSCKRFLSEY